MAATMKKIAQEASVSVSLVSRLLRGDDTLRTSTETKKRVLDVCQRLGGAKTLPGTQRRGLHVVVPINRAVNHKVTPTISRPDSVAFDRYLGKSGGQMSIVLFDKAGRRETFNRIINRVGYCQGMLLYSGIADAEIEKLFINHPFPHVCIDPAANRYQLNTLFADMRGAVMQAVGHLLELGHTRIGYVGSSQYTHYKRFTRELEDNNLAFNPQDMLDLQVPEDKKDDDHTVWLEAAKQSLIERAKSTEGIKFTALYCQNDAMALGAVAAMKELGLVPGKDLSIIGNDNIEARGGMYGVVTTGPSILTTIHQPFEQVGQRAAEWLLQQHLGQSKHIMHQRIPTKLIVRQTTGPAKAVPTSASTPKDCRAGFSLPENSANQHEPERDLAQTALTE